MSVRPKAGTAERPALPHAPQRDQVVEIVEARTAATACAREKPTRWTVAVPVPPRSAGPGPLLSKRISSHVEKGPFVQ
jgi:hypothetical protein